MRLLFAHKKKSSFLFFIPYALIMLLVLFLFQNTYCIKIIPDEFGYWSAGAYLYSFEAWHDISIVQNYYGFGYGFILGFLLNLPLSYSDLYFIAIIINGLFLCCIYRIVYLVVSTELPSSTNIEKIVLATTIAIIPSNLFYTQFTLAEIPLSFCYWFMFFFIWKYIKTRKRSYVLLYALFLGMLPMIHLRTVGIIAVSYMTIIFLLIRTKDFKSIFITTAVVAALLFIFWIIKSDYTSYITPSVDFLTTEHVDSNRLESQYGRIKFLFSIKGIKNFFIQSVARFYYAIISTGSLIILSALGFLKIIKTRPQNSDVENQKILYIFAILNFVSEIAIANIYCIIDPNGRLDTLTYGRYFEFTIGPIVLLGIIYNYKERIGIHKFFIILTSIISFGFLTELAQRYGTDRSHIAIFDSKMYFWFNTEQYKSGSIILSCLFLALVLSILMLLAHSVRFQKHIIAMICGTLLLWTIYNDTYTYSLGIAPWSNRQIQSEQAVAAYINDNQLQDKVYGLYEDHWLSNSDFLQFILKENGIHVVKDINDLYTSYPDCHLLTSMQFNVSILDEYDYQPVISSEKVTLWKRSNKTTLNY